MKSRYIFILLLCILFSCHQNGSNNTSKKVRSEQKDYAIVLHGGAGTILKANLSAEKEAEYRTSLNEALEIGTKILSNGGQSLDAVVEVIKYLENDSLFNAGKGAVFTNAGVNEMDASIMVGNTMQAGAVGGVTNIKNPITAAKAVMEKSNHVMMVGKGAEAFAEKNNLELIDRNYFKTTRRFESLQRVISKEKDVGSITEKRIDEKFGTVGVVALDKNGVLVAGTSTGGMTNKRYNRIGDSPIIGAGTYANKVVGVSCTGHGEYFIRHAVAHDVAARMEYKNMSVAAAADEVVNRVLVKAGGSGGLIAMDKYGNISMPFNTPGMYRAYATPTETYVGIFADQ